MNREEAKHALSEGKRLTHKYFTSEEWIEGHYGMYMFEDDCTCSPIQFWETRTSDDWDEGWRVISQLSAGGKVAVIGGRAIGSETASLLEDIEKETRRNRNLFSKIHTKPFYLKGRW